MGDFRQLDTRAECRTRPGWLSARKLWSGRLAQIDLAAAGPQLLRLRARCLMARQALQENLGRSVDRALDPQVRVRGGREGGLEVRKWMGVIKLPFWGFFFSINCAPLGVKSYLCWIPTRPFKVTYACYGLKITLYLDRFPVTHYLYGF